MWDTTRYGDTVNERAVRILLECILVIGVVLLFYQTLLRPSQTLTSSVSESTMWNGIVTDRKERQCFQKRVSFFPQEEGAGVCLLGWGMPTEAGLLRRGSAYCWVSAY